MINYCIFTTNCWWETTELEALHPAAEDRKTALVTHVGWVSSRKVMVSSGLTLPKQETFVSCLPVQSRPLLLVMCGTSSMHKVIWKTQKWKLIIILENRTYSGTSTEAVKYSQAWKFANSIFYDYQWSFMAIKQQHDLVWGVWTISKSVVRLMSMTRKI